MTLTAALPFAALRRTWQPVANAPALPPGAVTGYTLLGLPLAIARFPDGTLLAADVACPHKGARLSAGFWSLAISPGFNGPPADEQVEFAVNVLDEDRRMRELQIPPEVPINPARGGWGGLVTPGDTLANTFQRQFRRWLQTSCSPARESRDD